MLSTKYQLYVASYSTLKKNPVGILFLSLNRMACDLTTSNPHLLDTPEVGPVRNKPDISCKTSFDKAED